VKTANTIAIDRAQAMHKMAVVAHMAANRPPPKAGVQ